jgi:predicted glycosyltransferase
VLCGAGFATPAEALFLKKKLMVVPMKGQYEQQCNAAALEQLGVKVIKSFKEKHLARIKQWVSEDQMISIDFPDNSESLIEKIMSDFNGNKIEITKDKLTIPAIETYSKIFKKGKPNYFFKIFKG